MVTTRLPDPELREECCDHPVYNPIPDDLKRSFFEDLRREEELHKWLESEKVGYDLGFGAVIDWVRNHWQGYLRAKWIEHLEGNCYWIELDRGDFNLVQTQLQNDRDLVDPILDHLKRGGENLTILKWAIENHLPSHRVLAILEVIDINGRRMPHPIEA